MALIFPVNKINRLENPRYRFLGKKFLGGPYRITSRRHFGRKFFRVYDGSVDGWRQLGEMEGHVMLVFLPKNDGSCWQVPFSSMIFHLSISIENYLQLYKDLAAATGLQNAISQDTLQRILYLSQQYGLSGKRLAIFGNRFFLVKTRVISVHTGV